MQRHERFIRANRVQLQVVLVESNAGFMKREKWEVRLK